MEEWQDIKTAPYRLPVVVQLEDGSELLAELVPNASMTDEEMPCDQWQEIEEGSAPPCWTDGACWESNHDEVMSLQPRKWRSALSAAHAVAVDQAFEARTMRSLSARQEQPSE
jgi:hypothetical protein